MASEVSDQQLAELPQGWKFARLGDMISLRGGLSYKAEFLSDSGNSLVTMGCVSASERFKKAGLKRYSGDFTERHRLRVGDMVIATRDVTQNRELLGSPALVPKGLPGESIIAATNLYMVTNHSDSPTEFIYWLMKTPAYRNQIIASAKGTTIVMLTKDSVENFTFPLPPLSEQRAIASVLGALDDKIEVNRRMNATLEAMARALFQSWFVDFDPVRAKNGGRQPEGMDADTAALFPAEFEESELGMIPKGWEVKPISEMVALNYGKNLPKTKWVGGNIPVYGAAGIVGYYTKAMFLEPIILVTSRGSGSGTVHETSEPCFVTNNSFSVIPINPWFSRHYLRQALLNSDIEALVTGSAQPQLTISNFSALRLLKPPKAILQQFHKIADALWAKASANSVQSRTVAALRDTLLPKLLSGELRIQEPTQ